MTTMNGTSYPSSFIDAEYENPHCALASIIRGVFHLAVHDIVYGDRISGCILDQLFERNDSLMKSILLSRWPHLDRYLTVEGGGKGIYDRKSASSHHTFLPSFLRRLIHLLGLRACLRFTLLKLFPSSAATTNGNALEAIKTFRWPEPISNSLREYAGELEKDTQIPLSLRNWSSISLRSAIDEGHTRPPRRSETTSNSNEHVDTTSTLANAPSNPPADASKRKAQVPLLLQEIETSPAVKVITILGKVWMAYMLYLPAKQEEEKYGSADGVVESFLVEYSDIRPEINQLIRKGINKVHQDKGSSFAPSNKRKKRKPNAEELKRRRDESPTSCSQSLPSRRTTRHRSPPYSFPSEKSDVSAEPQRFLTQEEAQKWTVESNDSTVLLGNVSNTSDKEMHSLITGEQRLQHPQMIGDEHGNSSSELASSQSGMRQREPTTSVVDGVEFASHSPSPVPPANAASERHHMSRSPGRPLRFSPGTYPEVGGHAYSRVDAVDDEIQGEKDFQKSFNPSGRRCTSDLFSGDVFCVEATLPLPGVDSSLVRSENNQCSQRHEETHSNSNGKEKISTVRYYSLENVTKRYRPIGNDHVSQEH